MLHPQARAFVAADATAPHPGDPDFDLEQSRKAMRDDLPERTGAAEEVAVVVDVDAGGVPCRLYRPVEGAPVVVHLHGGGWVQGDVDSHDTVCRRVATRSGWAVLSVDYRLSPEHSYPAALEDAEAAVSWLRAEGARLDVDASRLALLGDSAGGNLAAAMALRSRPAAAPYLLQVLVYPCLDAGGAQPSYRQEDAGFTCQEMDWFWRAYAPDVATRARSDVSPLSAPELTGLPPALILTAEHDPLRDEAEAYARRLADAGVEVVCTRYIGMVHGFWRRPATFDASRAAVDQVAAALRSAAG